jgi:hypothetical protein
MRWLVDIYGAHGYLVGEEWSVGVSGEKPLEAKRRALELVKPIVGDTALAVRRVTRIGE